jgi:hypothetical protein
MLDWTPTPISARRAGRLLWLAIITVVLITALAGPAISVPPSAAGSDVTGDQAGRSGQWIARPPLRQARAGLGVARVGRQILAIGGFERVGVVTTVFDVVEARRVKGTGRWRDLAPMPTARANLATTEVGGLVYAIGGIEAVGLDEFIDSNVVETFNPRSGRWATSLPLPQPRSGPGAAGLGGLLYVAGGFIPLTGDDFEITNSVLAYDPKQNTWRSVAPMPTARERLRLVASGRYLYAIGGFDLAGQSLATVERYDPKSNTWATMNPMIESRYLPCAVETRVGHQRVLVVVGGFEFAPGGVPIGARRTTEVFDPHTGRWTLLDVLLPIARGSHDCATEADGTVLAIGGGNPVAGFLANVDALSLKPRDLRSH